MPNPKIKKQKINFGVLKTNPTLVIYFQKFGENSLNCKIQFYTFKKGPKSFLVSNTLGRTLAYIQTGANPRALFHKEVIELLYGHEILVHSKPTKTPIYTCALKNNGKILLDKKWEINPSFKIRHSEEAITLCEIGSFGQILAEYSVDEEIMNSFLNLSSNNSQQFSVVKIMALAEVNCLAHPKKIKAIKDKLAKEYELCHQNYKRNNFAKISNLVRPLELISLKKYCENLKKNGYLDGDFNAQNKQRSHFYDDQQLKWLHKRLLPILERISGIKLEPSYSFLAFYWGGGEVPLHYDKKNCFITASLAINASKKDLLKKWPLIIKTKGSAWKKLYWAIGEALIFNGHLIQHSRPALPKNQWADIFIMHYARI